MRYKAYIDSKGDVVMAQYRTGFKPEKQTFASREEALTALAQGLSDRLSPTEDEPEFTDFEGSQRVLAEGICHIASG